MTLSRSSFSSWLCFPRMKTNPSPTHAARHSNHFTLQSGNDTLVPQQRGTLLPAGWPPPRTTPPLLYLPLAPYKPHATHHPCLRHGWDGRNAASLPAWTWLLNPYRFLLLPPFSPCAIHCLTAALALALCAVACPVRAGPNDALTPDGRGTQVAWRWFVVGYHGLLALDGTSMPLLPSRASAVGLVGPGADVYSGMAPLSA